MPVYEEKEKVDGQKRYYVRTYVTDENGNSKQITRHNKNWIGREGKKEAEWEESKLKNQTYNEIRNISVNELVEEHIQKLNSLLKQSTLIRYNELYKIYIKDYFHNKRIFKINTKDILNWHDYLDEKPIKLETKRKIHNLLKASLDHGCTFYGLQSNACKLVGNFKSKRGEIKKAIEFLTIYEFNKFISYEPNEIYSDFFSLLFFTGMRRGELLALTIKDIDFVNREIKINKSINPKNGTKATVPKTNKSNRIIPLLPNALNILEKYKNVSRNSEIFNLEIIKLSTLSRKCNKNCELAKIEKHVRLHDFRHSFVALCIESGVKIEKISEYVGHENISTTYDIYSHLYPSAKNELISKVNNFLTKQDQKQDQEK